MIDYRTEGFLAAVGQVDVVLDSSSQGTASLEVLREGGVLVSIMEHWNTALAAEVEAAGRRFAGISVEPDYASLEAIAKLVEEGRIRPHIAETFPLEEAGKAHELIATGRTQGKIVLTVA